MHSDEIKMEQHGLSWRGVLKCEVTFWLKKKITKHFEYVSSQRKTMEENKQNERRIEINLKARKSIQRQKGSEVWARDLSPAQNQLCFQSSQEDLVSLVNTSTVKAILRPC